jgi:deazaflavin-dependent oxidoreductase (nitroreductase family)
MTDQQDYNRKLIDEFRAARSDGNEPMPGRPLLLLTTTGARSGQRRTTPLMYMPDGDRLIVFASNIGAPSHPDWYRNLSTHPDVTVEVGRETFAAAAVTLSGNERARVWNQALAQYPFFAEHQAKTTREIPLVALVRRPE